MKSPTARQSESGGPEHVTDAFFEVDSDWRVTFWNAGMESRTGHHRETVVGESLWPYLPNNLARDDERRLRVAMRTREELRFVSSADSVAFEVSVYPTSSGLGVHSRAVPALDHNRRLDVLFEGTSRYVLFMRPNGLILEANPAILNVFDLPAETLVGATLDAETWPNRLQETMRTLAELLERTADGSVVEEELQFPDGRIFASFRPIFGGDGAIDYVSFEGHEVAWWYGIENGLERMFQSSNDLMCIANFDGYFKRLNAEWERTLGWSQSVLLERPWIEFVHPDDAEATIAAGEKLFAGAEVTSFTNRYRCSNGEYRWLSWNAVPAMERKELYCVVHDVTREKQYELELERERDLFQRVQSMAHIGAWELDIVSNELHWTDEVYRIHGLSPLEAPPNVEDAIDFYHPKDRPTIDAAVERALETGEGWDFELRFIRADDQVIWVHAKGDVVYENGEPVTIRGTFQDITHRHEQEEELARNGALLRQIIDTVPEAIFVKEADGTYYLANEATGAILGVSPADLEGQTGYHLLHDDAVERVRIDDQRVVTEGIEVSYPLETFYLADGTEKNYQVQKVPFEAPNGDRYILGVAVDISERIRAESRLERAIDELTQSKSELEVRYSQLEFFDGLLRHDVLNGLTVIRGTAEVLQDTTAAADRPAVQTIIDWSDDVTLLVHRVRDVIDVLTSGVTESKPVDVRRALVGEISQLTSAYPTTTVELDAPTGVFAEADDLLSEVLGNVVSNAVQHCDHDAPFVQIWLEELEDVVRIVVADDGPGVPHDRKETIFRRGETTHVKRSGAGFGLFFVDSMVDAYGGSIRVEDNDPRGSRFVVDLPRAR